MGRLRSDTRDCTIGVGFSLNGRAPAKTTAMPCDPSAPLLPADARGQTIRGFGEQTKRDYVRQVRMFAAFIDRKPALPSRRICVTEA